MIWIKEKRQAPYAFQCMCFYACVIRSGTGGSRMLQGLSEVRRLLYLEINSSILAVRSGIRKGFEMTSS